uniref:Exonuclease domain-containing protein n=1 Tax=Odontella aurita TaxID=265563 RepID=A0A7S4NEG9_9STRA|mmetsp:Transcript_59741/g.177024  ORF Transcript_59741/g.177024 Transcript_59741/m.177024 type:complete len:130 (+) Transcript_59741:97-486(+)
MDKIEIHCCFVFPPLSFFHSGCIFVGHGLSQDFAAVNLFVPPDQIIDTVEIYHQANRRNISLRFLVNYVLGRDMQQDVHDSVEDARAAFELYVRAVELKREGKFERYLTDIYEFGQKSDWKVGLDKGSG